MYPMSIMEVIPASGESWQTLSNFVTICGYLTNFLNSLAQELKRLSLILINIVSSQQHLRMRPCPLQAPAPIPHGLPPPDMMPRKATTGASNCAQQWWRLYERRWILD